MNHIVNFVHLEQVYFMPNPVHLFIKSSWPSGVLCRFMNSNLEAAQLYLLRHNTDQSVLCPKHTHNSHFLTGSLYTIPVLHEIIKLMKELSKVNMCTIFIGMDWTVLSCSCAIMKEPKLLPLQILNIRYFIH